MATDTDLFEILESTAAIETIADPAWDALLAPITPVRKGPPCPRCNGRGSIEAFSHVSNGICFACGGYGTIID